MKAACVALACKKSVGLFAQRGAGWIARRSIGQSALFAITPKAGSKTLVFAPFWASKKVTSVTKRDMVVFRNSTSSGYLESFWSMLEYV